ncbi:LysR family transcriptional regulator [Burkholderia sp. 22PA0106]|uniref:LysR family transcriptional regulator n=1 Tax=Burkholderia sp. 22PA0106 TaxID=3237371 RepID=UPI0039C1CF54
MRIDGLGELEALLAVARHASFSGAASELGVSRSAVSQTIASMEAKLGVLLFHRSTRSVSLTDAGRNFANAIAPALKLIEDASNQVSAQSDTLAGTLRINGSASGLHQAMPMFFDFMAKYPEIHLKLTGEDRLIDIVQEKFDLGIRSSSIISKDLIYVPFGNPQRYVVVGSRSYFERHPIPTRPEDLLSHNCVRFLNTSGRFLSWDFEKGKEKYKLDPSGNLTVNSSFLARDAVIKGVALAYCSEVFVAEDIRRGTMLSVLDTWIPKGERLGLYFANRRHLPRNFKALVEFAKTWQPQRVA